MVLRALPREKVGGVWDCVAGLLGRQQVRKGTGWEWEYVVYWGHSCQYSSRQCGGCEGAVAAYKNGSWAGSIGKQHEFVVRALAEKVGGVELFGWLVWLACLVGSRSAWARGGWCWWWGGGILCTGVTFSSSSSSSRQCGGC